MKWYKYFFKASYTFKKIYKGNCVKYMKGTQHIFLFPTEHVENHNWPIAMAETSTTLQAIVSDLASFKNHEHFQNTNNHSLPMGFSVTVSGKV